MRCALVTGLALLVSCTSSTEPPPHPSNATSTTASSPRTLADQAYRDRTFWYGDDLGSLFELQLERARLQRRDGTVQVRLDLRATNLLSEPGSIEVRGALQVAGERLAITPSAAGPGKVAASASVDLQVTAADASAGLDLDDAVLVLGADGQNQVRVPLDPNETVEQAAPVFDELRGEHLTLPSGATMTVTGSARHPRWGGGRAGQERLRIQARVDLAQLDARFGNGLLLHPSLTAPDGTIQSLGDQAVSPPGEAIVERAILVPPIAGRYVLTVLEVESGAQGSVALQLG